MLDPEQKILRVYQFENGEIFTRLYCSGDTALAYVFDGLEIALEPVFAE